MQKIHIILFTLACIPAFIKIRKHNPSLAFIFLVFLGMNQIYWWALTLLWINIFQLSFSLLFLALMIHFYEKPNASRFIYATSFWLLALHIHSTPSVAFPFVLMMAIQLIRVAKYDRSLWRPSKTSLIMLGLLLGPYIVMEFVTKFSNAKAAFFYLNKAHDIPGSVSRTVGIEAGQRAVNYIFTTFNMNVNLFKPTSWRVDLHHFLAAIAIITSLAYAGIGVFNSIKNKKTSPIQMIFLAIPISFIFQFMFFLAANRPILGRQYVLFMVPFILLIWSLPFAMFSAKLFKKSNSEKATAFLAVVIVILAHPYSLAYQEKTVWNFQGIHSGLIEVCQDAPEFKSIANGPFVAYQHNYEDLLTYVVNRYISSCQVSEDSEFFVIPSRQNNFPEKVDQDHFTLELIKIYKPGFGLYRKSQGPPTAHIN
ncbi:MAG: hypothetical protein ACOH5I_06125 [Oligoflexus sp.]